jgi:hypothetical protein
MKKSLTIWIFCMIISPSPVSSQTLSALAQELFQSYAMFRRADITTRRFTQAEMLTWLKPLQEKNLFTTTPVGTSAEGRTISMLTYGSGPTKVLLWSQMHGDEATATMALMDILNFFAHAPDHFVSTAIREKLTLFIIPMLNPDGAERFQRRTAQLIDMNRDALRLETPEARILKKVRDEQKPHFAFNLHDQDPRYTVGQTKKVSAIALLAPAFDEARADNEVRLPAKHLAAAFAAVMGQFIPGHVSKYDDTFEPRAFGDNVQRWGTSTVLVESGGWPGDREKMFIRKLNYVGLLTSLTALATGEYRNVDRSLYESLPFNTKYLYDVIIRNVTFQAAASVPAVRADIGIVIDEQAQTESGSVELIAKVADLGDLSTFGAFEDLDGAGKHVEGSLIQIDKEIPLSFLETFRKK